MAQIEQAFFIPFLDALNLKNARNILVLPSAPMNKGKTFLLYPCVPEKIGLEDCKNLPTLDFLDQPITIVESSTTTIDSYAESQGFEMLHEEKDIHTLADRAGWLPEALLQIYQNRGQGFFNWNTLIVATLRVYHLAQPLTVKTIDNPKLGKFSGGLTPLNLDSQLSITDAIPVLSDAEFGAKIKQNQWIKTIAELGNRSTEKAPKSSYQAGTDFENISRKSLEFLGFTVAEAYRGGAGGLDLYCSKPYPLVIECKSGKTIPTNTVQEVINLTLKHLGKDSLVESKQLIIGPGTPTRSVLQSAINSEISIMKPETLEKLVHLKATYPGAIDLLKLKEYLQPGQIDEKIQDLIDRIEEKLSIRRQIIQAVKDNYPDTHTESIRLAYKLKYKPKQSLPDLKNQEIRDILIELSSPLTGYLGRETDERGDRFYYQRDLAPLSSAKQ